MEPQLGQEGTGATMQRVNLGIGSTYEKRLFYGDAIIYGHAPWDRLCDVIINPILVVL